MHQSGRTQKAAVGFVAIRNLIEVTEIREKSFKRPVVGLGNFKSRQNTAGIAAVIAVVEQAYVPTTAEGIQELQERPRSLREFKPA